MLLHHGIAHVQRFGIEDNLALGFGRFGWVERDGARDAGGRPVNGLERGIGPEDDVVDPFGIFEIERLRCGDCRAVGEGENSWGQEENFHAAIDAASLIKTPSYFLRKRKLLPHNNAAVSPPAARKSTPGRKRCSRMEYESSVTSS